MEWRRAGVEVVQSVRAHAVTAILMALVAAVMSGAVVASAGRVAMAERGVMAGIESSAPRIISVNVQAPAPGYSSEVLSLLQAPDYVDRVVPLGPVLDVGNPSIPARRSLAQGLLTPLPPEVDIVRGRYPGPGEALLSEQTMTSRGFAVPAGTLETDSAYRIVGSYSASGSLTDRARLVLLGPDETDDIQAFQLYIAATDVESVSLVTSQILGLSTPDQANAAKIGTSDELIVVTRTVSGELGSFARQLSA